jgi:hypothetical protein
MTTIATTTATSAELLNSSTVELGDTDLPEESDITETVLSD